MRNVIRAGTSEIFPIMHEIFNNGGESICITVAGSSMYPFLRDGIDEVELSRAEFEHVNVPDIVLVKRTPGDYILHRVIYKDKNCFYTAGDALKVAEGPFLPGHLQAVVTAVRKGNRRIPCDLFHWRLFSLVWVKCLPVRRYLLWMIRLPGRIGRMARRIMRRAG